MEDLLDCISASRPPDMPGSPIPPGLLLGGGIKAPRLSPYNVEILYTIAKCDIIDQGPPQVLTKYPCDISSHCK